MKTKICTKCGVEKDVDNFYKNYARCKECVKAHKKEYRSRPEVKAKDKEYGKRYRSRPEVKRQRNARKREYSKMKKNKEHRRIYTARYQQELRDGYVRNLLCRQVGRAVNTDEIPDHLVRIKRQSLILHREVNDNNHD